MVINYNTEQVQKNKSTFKKQPLTWKKTTTYNKETTNQQTKQHHQPVLVTQPNKIPVGGIDNINRG